MKSDKRRTKSAGAVIMSADGHQCLLVRQRQTQNWSFPKGTCMENETLENCMYREVFEETGVDLHQYRFFQNGKRRWKRYVLFLIFLLEPYTNIQLKINDNHEIDRVEWIDCKDIKDIKLNQVTASVLYSLHFKRNYQDW